MELPLFMEPPPPSARTTSYKLKTEAVDVCKEGKHERRYTTCSAAIAKGAGIRRDWHPHVSAGYWRECHRLQRAECPDPAAAQCSAPGEPVHAGAGVWDRYVSVGVVSGLPRSARQEPQLRLPDTVRHYGRRRARYRAGKPARCLAVHGERQLLRCSRHSTLPWPVYPCIRGAWTEQHAGDRHKLCALAQPIQQRPGDGGAHGTDQ